MKASSIAASSSYSQAPGRAAFMAAIVRLAGDRGGLGHDLDLQARSPIVILLMGHPYAPDARVVSCRFHP